ncbi:MAG: FAD-dependent oxidoreductase [Patescibacteria group bacterium]|nr:FAD-dependent oxidoreductase [Patescibacteria group bacterium]
MNDLIIIGGGPAGVSAAVYAARKHLSTVLISEDIGGQSIVSEGIENWIGWPKISGSELAKALREHIEALKAEHVDLVLSDRAAALSKEGERFVVKTKNGKEFAARAVLIATGASRRKLDIPGADKFENKGVTYCASCDGPLFAGMDVAVVGGGNAGFETALQLLAYCKSVTLFHRHREFKADPVTVEKALAHPNMKVMTHAEPTEILGEQFVTGMRYLDKDANETKEIKVAGIFAEIGVLPNTEFAGGLLELDAVGRIKVDARNQRANVDGIWAAGDCTDELYHQNNIAAGDGVKALEDLYLWLHTR